METAKITETLLAAKDAKGLTFEALAKIIGRSEIWLASLFYRQASASEEEVGKLAHALGLSADSLAELKQFPTKGLGPVVPTDPMVYRFYEILQVYGMPFKAVIQEKFGDGIMSAVDFTVDVEKEENPAGDRVILTMSGKFLPYKKW